jgi:hypothetical protein
LAAALACAAGTLQTDAGRIDLACSPHCPKCGGQRFLHSALPKEGLGVRSTGADTP